MSVILFFPFVKTAFELGVLFGLGFVFIVMVVSMIATKHLLPEVQNSFLQGAFLAALIKGGAGLAVYLRGKQIQSGDL